MMENKSQTWHLNSKHHLEHGWCWLVHLAMSKTLPHAPKWSKALGRGKYMDMWQPYLHTFPAGASATEPTGFEGWGPGLSHGVVFLFHLFFFFYVPRYKCVDNPHWIHIYIDIYQRIYLPSTQLKPNSPNWGATFQNLAIIYNNIY